MTKLPKYGSIAHLPGSRLEHNHNKYATGKVVGVDVGVSESTARLLLDKCPKDHNVVVQEKLDGANVSVSRINGTLVTATRSGKPCISSKFEQHRLFDWWVQTNAWRFDFLREGERVVGEWLALAHGTIYRLPHEPFVAFDLIDDSTRGGPEDDSRGQRLPRLLYRDFLRRIDNALVTPHLLHFGPVACSIQQALLKLDPRVHGAQEEVEGAVWRLEGEGMVKVLAKYVRPTKVDGKYLTGCGATEDTWNWRPPKGN